MATCRREFLSGIGSGMFVASLGSALAIELGLATAHGCELEAKLEFGELEPLVDLMQQTPADSILPKLVEQLSQQVSLQDLVVAGALANARTFGGQDYDGYHAFMALAPALEMSKQLPGPQRGLPVLKVLYRNTRRMQECGGREHEVLHALPAIVAKDTVPTGEDLRAATRQADMTAAEETFARIARGPANEAYNHLQFAVQDEVDVHRTVLAWRAWKMTEIGGQAYGNSLLRQSVRYCVDAEQKMQARGSQPSGIRELLPSLLEELGALERAPGKRHASDAELQALSQVIFEGSREQAARAVTAALADGLSIDSVGEALSLAANQLLLFDPGRSPQYASADKPVGSVHGASVGVHACDSANAWRNIARVCNPRNQFASMIVGAYHTAGQQAHVGATELPYAAESASLDVASSELLPKLDEAIRSREQLLASSLTYRYLNAGQDPAAVFQLLLRFAISEEGALHAEKFYRTVQEEYASIRPACRDRQLVALARVSASEYGFPAAGLAEARQLLQSLNS